MVNFLLAVVGTLLLLLSLAGLALGLFMAFGNRTREPGLYFTLWWTPAVAAASGILMGDSTTFTIGALCFIVAGVGFVLERRGSRRAAKGKRRSSRSTVKAPLAEEADQSSEEARPRK
ncbi:MAG: hypothetical protein M3N18_09615 [Actinomycetota bacterium]|nr:hypothetical protein [Actinomycetota bacterium]